jgi:hypothetical protein
MPLLTAVHYVSIEACGGGLGQLPSEIVTLILSFAVPPGDTPLEVRIHSTSK